MWQLNIGKQSFSEIINVFILDTSFIFYVDSANLIFSFPTFLYKALWILSWLNAAIQKDKEIWVLPSPPIVAVVNFANGNFLILFDPKCCVPGLPFSLHAVWQLCSFWMSTKTKKIQLEDQNYNIVARHSFYVDYVFAVMYQLSLFIYANAIVKVPVASNEHVA